MCVLGVETVDTVSVLFCSPPNCFNNFKESRSWFEVSLQPTVFRFALPICPLCFQRDEMLQDGCDSHFCKVNERGEYIWEKRVTGCPPFDEHKCLAEGVSSWSSVPTLLLIAPSLTLRTESSEWHAVFSDMMCQCPRETPDLV